MRIGSRTSLRVLAAVATASVALVACSSQGGAQNQPAPAGGGGGGGGGNGQSYTIAMVTHEAPGDSFWDKIRAGAEQAAKLKAARAKEAALARKEAELMAEGQAVDRQEPKAKTRDSSSSAKHKKK